MDKARGQEIAAEQMAMVLASPRQTLPRRSVSGDRPMLSAASNNSEELEIPSLAASHQDTTRRNSELNKSRSRRGTALSRRKSRAGMETSETTMDNSSSKNAAELRRTSTNSSRRRRRSSQVVESVARMSSSSSTNIATGTRQHRPSLTADEEAVIAAAAAASSTTVQSNNLDASFKQRSRRMSQHQQQGQSRSSRRVNAATSGTPVAMTSHSDVVGDRAYSDQSNEELQALPQESGVARRRRRSSLKVIKPTGGLPLVRSHTLEDKSEDATDEQEATSRMSLKQRQLSRRATLASFANNSASNVKTALMMDHSDPQHKAIKRSSTLEDTISPALQRRVSLLSPFEVDNDSVIENAIAAVANGATTAPQSPPRHPMGRSKTFDERQRPGMSPRESSLTSITAPGLAGSPQGLQRQNSFTYSNSNTRGGARNSSVARRLLKRCESESAIKESVDDDDDGMNYLLCSRQSSDLTGTSLLEVDEDDLEKTQHTQSTSEVSTLSSSNERRSPFVGGKNKIITNSGEGVPAWRSKWEMSEQLQLADSFHTNGADSFNTKGDGSSSKQISKESSRSSLSMKLCGNNTSIRHQDRGDIMFVDVDDDTVSALSYQQQGVSLDGNTSSTNSKSLDMKSILSSETFFGETDEVQDGVGGTPPALQSPSAQPGDVDTAAKPKRMALTKLQSVSSMIKF